MSKKDSKEAVPIEGVIDKIVQANVNNANRITQLERQIDDMMKSITENREDTNSTKAEIQTMTARIESIHSLTEASIDETASKFEDSKHQWNDMNTNIKWVMEKLSQMSNPACISTIEQQNKTVYKEELDARTPMISIIENAQRPNIPTTTCTTRTQWEQPSETISYRTEPKVKRETAISPVIPVNGIKHSIIVPPASAAPAFFGKHSESPTQFLIRVEEYAESVHAWDHATLLNGISQFLRDSALEWYCQLRKSVRRPQTWRDFEGCFLAQFNSPVRKARQEQEWHQCKQKEDETINEFLVRLRLLWREQEPSESEPDLVRHLMCRMRNDLLNMVKISQNTSLDELITEVQQIEEVLYRRSKGERLSKQIKEVETLPKKNNNENNFRQTSTRWNNESRNYQVNEVTPNQYTYDQNQTTAAPNWSPQVNSYECYCCGGYGHTANICPSQYGNYRQQRNTPKSKNDRGALDERTGPAPF
ncbi:unnamed protein product [Adineta steineri]|uniref:CCHC-type domain-containing protein n=1 Tax=Adineta steineri TaxID=433720 RepID=A0A819RG86_9BILA|nr:unnamed protein product [Adineta steineri]